MIDILAVGAHADDVELGIGGIIARSAGDGRTICIVDVTDGALATGMDPGDRAHRADQAAAELGVQQRINLGLPDRGVVICKETIASCAALLRQLCPSVLLIPDHCDRHPDHKMVCDLWQEALFSSGLRKYGQGAPHRPRRVFGYGLIPGLPPDIVIDVSAVYEKKQSAVGCYSLSAEGFAATRSADVRAVEARDRYYGALIGVSYAETIRPLGHLILDSLL